jgi:phosphoribosylglycinamide formyltransferase-1
MPNGPKKIIVFASGSGSNAEQIILQAQACPWGKVSAVYCNNPEAGVIQRAERLGVPVRLFENPQLSDPKFVLAWLEQDAPDLIVLAGFLRKIPESIVEAFPCKIVNIHPALLPDFGGKGMYGMHVHKAVKESGAQKTGITVHYVNAAYDEGDIVFQAETAVVSDDYPEDIARKVQKLEHEHFAPVVLNLLKPETHGH